MQGASRRTGTEDPRQQSAGRWVWSFSDFSRRRAMKRVILATALAVGSIVFTGRPALAQIQEGWPADGELHWTPSQQEAPAVRPASVVTDPRYNYHHNRWWYFTSDNKLLVW